MKQTRKIRTLFAVGMGLILLFIAMLCNLLVSCADTNVARRPSDRTARITDSSTETLPPTTTSPSDLPVEIFIDPSISISDYHLLDFDRSGETEQFHQLPEGYTYPQGTHQFYIDHSIYLPEDFYRPDLIWGFHNIGGMIVPNASHTSLHYTGGIPFDKDYPDAKYAVWFYKFTDETLDKAFHELCTYYGLEYVTDYSDDRYEYKIYAATHAQLYELDANMEAWEAQNGYDFGYRYFSGAVLVPDLYDHDRPIP